MEEKEVIQTFWGKMIKPGEKVELESPDDVYTIMTNICLGEIDKKFINQSSTVKGKVETIQIDKIDPEGVSEPKEIINTVFGILTPSKCEHIRLHNFFSPLSTVELEVDGANNVYVSGTYIPISNEDEMEEDTNEK